jgi:hypothetical protein
MGFLKYSLSQTGLCWLSNNVNWLIPSSNSSLLRLKVVSPLTNDFVITLSLLFRVWTNREIASLLFKLLALASTKIFLALLPGIPQELRFPGIPDANLALFASRNPSRNFDSWQEFLL